MPVSEHNGRIAPVKYEKLRGEFITALNDLNLQGPFFVEQRLARHRGYFFRAVKDVSPGENWWEVLYFFAYEGPCWAYLPEQRKSPEFAWGNTLEQAYLNGILHQAS